MSSPTPPPKRIKFLRGLAEATDFDDASFDLVVFSFVIHECPQVGTSHKWVVAHCHTSGWWPTVPQHGNYHVQSIC